ncbi:hypothetical protein LSTR_LSTR015500 [Laodelphax striatellus]|uniref:Uncharacterized protein n=1 Tax=Laodelphax striatellus TaxID=195883 RepID=A0A482WP42_LAOST|nr:hypothetical protein LSTR_LSTR015500 [Laodelphax striatellus]
MFLNGIFEVSEDGDPSNEAKRYSGQLDTPERRSTFAQRLREALCRAESGTSSESSSYAIGISITGSSMEDNEIRMKRGGSRGFMLEDDRTRGWGEGTNSVVTGC